MLTHLVSGLRARDTKEDQLSKMNNAIALCFCILIVSVTVTSVSSIRCYECLSCNDPFDEGSATITTCSGSCIKGKSGDTVVRGCSDDNGGDTCINTDGADACSCTSDLCNSASGMSISMTVVCLSIVTLFLWGY